MNTMQVVHLCAMAGLGEPLEEPQAVTGGLLHRVWRLKTSTGTFALKQLNAALLQRPGVHHAYRLSEKIAGEMAARGIPAVAALAHDAGDVLYELDDMTLLVYKWVDGAVLSTEGVTLEQVRQVGALLARMHALNLRLPEVPPLEWTHFEDEDWDILTFQASDLNLAWANPVRSVLPRLLEWTRAYEEAGKVLSQHMLVSHTHCDPSNVIWSDPRTPWLIDWEAAGLVNPTMELVGTALTWSGLLTGEGDKERFTVLLTAYCDAGGTIVSSGQDAINGYMGTMLGWLLFNMRCTLGESVASDEEQLIGLRETTSTLASLRILATHAPTWAALLDACH
ncbi:phosphotransferase [Dictyobacter halimunensis]